jgi:hypothetical protein
MQLPYLKLSKNIVKYYNINQDKLTNSELQTRVLTF